MSDEAALRLLRAIQAHDSCLVPSRALALAADEAAATLAEAQHLDVCERCRWFVDDFRNAMTQEQPVSMRNPRAAAADARNLLDVSRPVPGYPALAWGLIEDEESVLFLVETHDPSWTGRLIVYELRSGPETDPVRGFFFLRPSGEGLTGAEAVFSQAELSQRLGGQCWVSVEPWDADLLTPEDRPSLLSSVDRSRDDPEQQSLLNRLLGALPA